MGVGYVVGIGNQGKTTVVYTGNAKVEEEEQVARNPWARAQEQEYDSDSGEGNNTKSGSGTGSSAHLRIRTAATRTRRPQAPPPGKVFDSKD